MVNDAKISLDEIAKTLSEIGVMLLSNGATSSRASRNLKRIAESFGFNVELFFSHSAIVLTVENPFTGKKETIVKGIGHYHVNYSIVSEISILSWEIVNKKLSFEDIGKELDDIREMDSYPEWLKALFIGIATAALCKIFDGSAVEFFVAFMAAILGFFARKIVLGKKYNQYISWLLGAFVSASVVNFCRHFGLEAYHGALTSCVLWLIPGVPLINGFLDILSGHIVSGGAKTAMGFLLVFMIAIGFYLSLFLFGYGTF